MKSEHPIRRIVFSLIAALAIAGCTTAKDSGSAQNEFVFDFSAVYFAKSGSGIALRNFCPIRADKTFAGCASEEAYAFSGGNKANTAIIRDETDAFMLMPSRFDGTGTFALTYEISPSPTGGAGFSFPSTSTETFNLQSPGTVITDLSGDDLAKLKRIIRRMAGPTADQINYVTLEKARVECIPPAPLTNRERGGMIVGLE